MAPSASTSGGGGGGSNGLPRLQSVDDVISLAVQIASGPNPIHDVAAVLVPALEKLMSLKGGYEVLLQASAGGEDPLGLLDAKTHTVAYLYILTTRLQVEASYQAPDPPATGSLTPAILACLTNFCGTYEPHQIVLGGNSGSATGGKLTELARAVTVAVRKGYLDAWNAWSIVGSLHYGLATVAPGNMTTLDVIYIALGRRAHVIEQAALLEKRPPTFNTADRGVTPLEPIDVLAFFFETGQAFIEAATPGSHSNSYNTSWLRQAKPYFEQCLTAPVHRAPHDMQIQAAARWFLLTLGLSEDDDDDDGSHRAASISLPAYTSTAMLRVWKRHSTPAYTILADLYTSRRRTSSAVSELHKFVQADAQMSVWQRDGTLGLVTWLVQERYPAARVARLGATFTRLRVRDVVGLLELQGQGEQGDAAATAVEKSVKEEIEKWIAEGRLKGAKVEPAGSPDDSGAAILSFHQPPPDNDASSMTAGGLKTTSSARAGTDYSSLASLSDLRLQMERLQRCNADLEARERDLARSKAFVNKMQSGAAMGRGAGVGGMGMGMSMGGFGGGGGGRLDPDDEDVFGA